jgi:hypothetical protein
MSGYFEKDVIYDGPIGGQYRGLLVVKLIA